jgi:hypothetical protein
MKPILNPLAQLVRDLDTAGLKLAFSGDRIAVFPARSLTPELRERIAPLRAELVELLGIHGPALLPLFRAPELLVSAQERDLLAANAASLRASQMVREQGAA